MHMQTLTPAQLGSSRVALRTQHVAMAVHVAPWTPQRGCGHRTHTQNCWMEFWDLVTQTDLCSV